MPNTDINLNIDAITGVGTVGYLQKAKTVVAGKVKELEDSYFSEGAGALTAIIDNINANFGITTSNVNGTGNLSSQSNFLQQTSTVYGGTDLVGIHSYPSSHLIVGRFTSVLGYSEIVSGFAIGESNIYAKSPNIYAGSTAVFSDDGDGNIILISGPAPSGGISSLNALTGATQTFANDTNVTIVSAGTTHTLTWAGTLADARIASASTWNAKESALSFSTGLTRTVNSVANDLITGLAGGQTIISGTAATDKLIIKTTTGNQTTGASNLVSIKSGNNGANELIRIGDGIGANIGEMSIWAAGQSSSSTHLLRAGTNFTYINAGTDLRLQVGAVNYINMLSGAGTVAIQKPLTFATGANVTLVAGSTTVAPLIFTSGTNKTTPTNGSMEYNGTNFFATRAGAVRENIVCASAVNTVSPTSPNRTITVNIDGTTFYIAAKTTND